MRVTVGAGKYTCDGPDTRNRATVGGCILRASPHVAVSSNSDSRSSLELPSGRQSATVSRTVTLIRYGRNYAVGGPEVPRVSPAGHANLRSPPRRGLPPRHEIWLTRTEQLHWPRNQPRSSHGCHALRNPAWPVPRRTTQQCGEPTPREPPNAHFGRHDLGFGSAA